jgi:hypothetical protein
MAYNNGYTYKRTLTIQNAEVAGSVDLTNFVVLFKGTYAYLADTANDGNVEHSSGYDIRFETTGGTKLNHHIEKYDNTTGDVVIWIQVDSVSYDEDTVINLYYGKPGLTATEENKTGTWSVYDGVWLLNEAAGGSGAIKDSTTNANHMSNSGSQLTFGDTGKINKAVSRTNSSAELSRLLTDGNMNIPAGALTVMVWAKIASTTQASNGQIVWQENSGRFRFYTTGGATFQARTYKTSSTLDATTFGTLTQDQWHHLAIRIPGVASEYVKSYKDGANAATGSNVDSYIGTNTQVALFSSATAAQWFYGSISHLMISTDDLGEGWIQTCFNNQDDPASFIVVGDETTDPGATNTGPTDPSSYGVVSPGNGAYVVDRTNAYVDDGNVVQILTASYAFYIKLSHDGGTSWTDWKTVGAPSSGIVTLGTSNDNWGRTWSPSEFSNANFKLFLGGDNSEDWTYYGISLGNFDISIPAGATINGIFVSIDGYDDEFGNVYVDYITVSVYYTYVNTDKTVTARARIGRTEAAQIEAITNIRNSITNTLQSKSNIRGTVIQSIVAQANIAGLVIGAPTLIVPIDTSSQILPVTLIWEIPEDPLSRDLHFRVQIDKTDSNFQDIQLDKVSYLDLEFEYWDGDSWEPITEVGVTSAYYGNQARLTIANLPNDTYYWRVDAIAKC